MIIHGDSLIELAKLPENSVDAVVTDPPYGWRFMGKAWDAPDISKMAKSAVGKEPRLCADGKVRGPRQDCKSIAAGTYDTTLTGNQTFQIFSEGWAREVFRVLKPGGHMLVFCGPRTYHRMAAGVEDAGFEIRDQLQWIFGSGFPKSHNIGDGRGTALKPANEPIVLARKPLSESTVAKNVEKWRTGAINVDASRIGVGSEKPVRIATSALPSNGKYGEGLNGSRAVENSTEGRWPANVLFDESAAESLGEPSRFFYVAKASKRERNAGLEGMPERETKSLQDNGGEFKTGSGNERNNKSQNHHPTVKPIKLMEYLCRLITPPGGVILDPFMGSGSTGVAAKRLGFEFIGIEMNEEYVEIARRRIA